MCFSPLLSTFLNFDFNSSHWNKQEAELQFEFEFKNDILGKLCVEWWLKLKNLKVKNWIILPFYMYIWFYPN